MGLLNCPSCLCVLLHQGERLSHAVGCAFAACLERKQRREKECGVTASFDASRTSFVREGSFRANSSCSQQGSSSERDDKLPDKKKGRKILQNSCTFAEVSFKKCSYSLDVNVSIVRYNSLKWSHTHLLLQTNRLQSQPSHLAPPPRLRVLRPPWSDRNQVGLTPSHVATRPSSSWCVRGRSGGSPPSARRTPPSRGSCRSASTTCRRHCNGRLISRPRIPVSWEVLEVRLANVGDRTLWPPNFCYPGHPFAAVTLL